MEELFWEGADLSEVATLLAGMRYVDPGLPPLKSLSRVSPGTARASEALANHRESGGSAGEGLCLCHIGSPDVGSHVSTGGFTFA